MAESLTAVPEERAGALALGTWRPHWIAGLLYALRSRRRVVSLTAYGSLTAIAYLAAFAVHFDFAWQAGYASTVMRSLLLLVSVRLLADHVGRLSTHRWRFVGMGEIRRLVVAVVAGTLLFWPLASGFAFQPSVPARVLLLEPVFTLLLTAGLWMTYRMVFELFRRRDGENGQLRNVVVVGAGEAGETLVRQMMRHPTGYRPVAFVDDDPVRKNALIHDVKVLGDSAALCDVVHQTGADEIVIAIPSASPEDLRRIVECCQATELPYRVLPGITSVLDGDVSLAQLRQVEIEDLLGRDPVELELPELVWDLAGQVILITGAAGSIGSELARQVARHDPERLVLLDQSETGIFYLELELRELAPNVELIPVVADVVDAAAIERVFAVHRPSRVFHAAAYKHVPMMQVNCREALRNNVIGTWRVAAAAGRHGAEKYVLVSTDKAVRPANMMGATKRVAEIVVLELQALHPHTAFGAVRFGNVLGSAGSVIPVFKRQLEQGKPLTVTHPEVTRYFMTITEAVQLVLQASVLPDLRGRIALLDMGEPVRIVDLARSLVQLSGGGLGNGSIVFTGLRPGEKLHEDLVAPGERAHPTVIPKIRILHLEAEACDGVLARMPDWDRWLAEWRPEEVLEDLHRIVPELSAGGANGARTDGQEGLDPDGNDSDRVRTRGSGGHADRSRDAARVRSG